MGPSFGTRMTVIRQTRDFLGILGYKVLLPSSAQIDEALRKIGDMSVSPAKMPSENR